MKPIKNLIIHGTKEELGDGVTTYVLEPMKRDGTNSHTVKIDDNDQFLEMTLEDGTTWMVDPATLHEVFPELDPAINTSSRDGDTESVEMPQSMVAPATQRGIIGKIAVKLLKVFAKKAIDGGIEKIAKKLEDKHLLNHIEAPVIKQLRAQGFPANGATLLRVNKAFQLKPYKAKTSGDPFFLFIHGTNSDTYGAYEDLQNSTAWETLHDIYGENVLAFQHRTLTESPLENVVKLVKLLPNNARLHIISHSRGGLVGDILNKYCSSEGPSKGFKKRHIDLLESEEDRESDIENIKQLRQLFTKKKLTIEKFIRVACPGAGTKLASKRLDHVLNVFSNLMRGVFGDILKELLKAAIQTKDNTDILPGLEAMNPDSPFIKVLNDPSQDAAIEGKSLAVISGNGQLSVSGHGLLVLLGKLFYWQRNDLVVNTDSMYLGVKRSNNIQYFFDQGKAVNHVKYFENKTSLDAIDLALKADEGALIPGFKSVPQSAVPSTDRALVEYGELYPPSDPPSGDRPIAILLPGIMGSNLEREDKEIWLHYGRILTGGLTDLKYTSGNKIDATSVVKTSYFKLHERLSTKYDVMVFPFDWRVPLTQSAKLFDAKIRELLAFNQPIKILGHSMGGVLVRDFIINHPDTWKDLNQSEGFKLVFLGSPLGGSHRILTVLFGEDAIIKKLSKLDMFHSKKRLLRMFSKFPGILGLLPLTTDDREDYANEGTWKRMRDVFGKRNWPLPTASDLNNFKKYRDQILAQRDNIDYSNMVYVAGKDKMTAAGYYLDEVPPKEKLYFLYTSEGDQSVTWKLGIPQQLKDLNQVFYTRVSHGALANAPEIFDGIEEILVSGTTRLLSQNPPVTREEAKLFRTEPDIDFDISSYGLEKTLFGGGDARTMEVSKVPLSTTITNGDLRYATYPVLAGHFQNDGILYAERAIDNYLDRRLTNKHKLGLYPGKIGTNAIFDAMGESDFAGAIIVGLGEPDFLTSLELAKSVEHGVLNYLFSIVGKDSSNKGVGVSALIMASGYGGLTIESSMKAIITGVNRANDKIRRLDNEAYHKVEHLEFIERYANRALNCMYVLNGIQKSENINFNISIGNRKIQKRLGIQKRIPMDSTEDWWKRITVKYKPGNEATKELSSMTFNVSTKDSREEENQLYSSTPLIDLFIEEVSTKDRWEECTAKTLFELLIPNALKEELKRKGNINWIVDANTAAYPWELLQDNTFNAQPLCINAGMIRQLSTPDYRMEIKRVARPGALVIADPILDGFIGQLPGAKEEGTEVQKVLQNSGYPVRSLIGQRASNIVRDFFCQDYSIIHLAGHGVYDADAPKRSGMVIGDELFLSVFEIEQLPIVPDLVFVNCCHLGSVTATEERYYKDRYKLAANIGTELIKIGVKAVIAAGWAVNDVAAREFSRIFYESMFRGNNFGDAVKEARGHIYEHHSESNTWGAYQCYGDPFFVLKNMSSREWNPSYIVSQEAEIHLDNLLNDINMGIKTNVDFIGDLEKITKAVNRDVTETASIVERQARIYYELAKYEEAAERFSHLLSMEKADFSFSCMEKYCNTLAKLFVKQVYQTGKVSSPELLKDRFGRTKRVIKDLNTLLMVGETNERLNMLGSAYKRLAMLAPDRDQRMRAFQRSMGYYQKAADNSVDGGAIYPLTNAIELSAILVLSKSKKPGDKFRVADHSNTVYTRDDAIKILSEKKNRLEEFVGKDSLDYWDMLAFLNIDLCLLMVNEDQKIENERWDAITQNFNMIWQKAGSEGKKHSELEHLKFLIFSLQKAVSEKDGKNLPYKEKASPEDLIDHMAALRAALNRLKGFK